MYWYEIRFVVPFLCILVEPCSLSPGIGLPPVDFAAFNWTVISRPPPLRSRPFPLTTPVSPVMSSSSHMYKEFMLMSHWRREAVSDLLSDLQYLKWHVSKAIYYMLLTDTNLWRKKRLKLSWTLLYLYDSLLLPWILFCWRQTVGITGKVGTNIKYLLNY